MELKVIQAGWQRAASCYIRMKVFVLEKGIAIEDEFDQFDSDDTLYVVIYDEHQPVATGRLLEEDAATARFTRIAVLKEYRKHHLGRKIIEALEIKAQELGYQQSIIHSELVAKGFYQKLGYTVCSEVYLEDGVPCITLQKKQMKE
ncbi:MAG: GNAT family N-acetyltransferase [Enterococcus sp.]